MSELDYITVGDHAAFDTSPGFRDWMRTRGQRAKRSSGSGSAIERKPPPAAGTVGRRLATRRRDLELRDMGARIAPALAAAPAISLDAASNGSFYARALIDGRDVSMVVDTGATACSLTEEDAARVGIRLRSSDFTMAFVTQNGRINVAPVCLRKLQIGAITMHNVEAVVGKRVSGAESLLGMSFLRRLREFSMEGGRFILRG